MDEKEKLIDEMKSLTEKINKASYEYYVLDSPSISDKEWDELYYRLLDLEKITGVILPNSPSQRVGGEILSKFKKVNHSHKLYSLSKAQSTDEIEEWITRNKNITNFDEEYSVEYKFDGLSLCISYENGKLVQASTRGNGEIGEDVTSQVKTIRTVPLTIKFLGKIDIQGEGIIKLSEFEKYNKTAVEKLKNARNAVAGAIRNLDPTVTASRNLDFFAYNVNFCPDKHFSSQQEIKAFLDEQGFMTGDFFKLAKNLDEISKIIKNVNNIRDKLDYLIDGLVIKVNDTAVREKLGFTEKSPRWAVAFKFEAEETSTVLENITWQVGRTGKITPVAELEPTELCGVTIKRATLNNFNDLSRKQLKIGDRVFIRRSNDVIPEVLSVAESYENSKEIEKPTTCPCCGSKLEDTGTELYCTNHFGCRTQIVLRLTQYASRNAMNIEGLSIKTLERLYDKFNINSFSDIYRLDESMLSQIEGFKDKKITNILNSIQKSKSAKLSNFIFALGIDGIGVKMAKTLASTFKTIDALQNATESELIKIEDVAEITAQNICHYFSENGSLAEINELLNKHVKLEMETERQKQGFFSGKKVVLTGTLQNFSRTQASEIIEAQGGSTLSAVSKLVDIVIVGENAGSKLEKALELKIRIMYEPEFLNLIKNN